MKTTVWSRPPAPSRACRRSKSVRKDLMPIPAVRMYFGRSVREVQDVFVFCPPRSLDHILRCSRGLGSGSSADPAARAGMVDPDVRGGVAEGAGGGPAKEFGGGWEGNVQLWRGRPEISGGEPEAAGQSLPAALQPAS